MDAGFTARQQRSNQAAMDFHPALPLAELPADAKVVATVAGLEVLLINDGGNVHALENRCSHADSPLDCGRVRLGWIACPAHGARFDLETGEALTGPATEPLRVFAVRVAAGMIEVEV
jgi:3-phenylpropionate/trans-cinnamate dioxygenase ferredoxin component